MDSKYSYENILGISELINWRIEDIIGGDKPNFLGTVAAIKREARKQIEAMAPAFC